MYSGASLQSCLVIGLHLNSLKLGWFDNKAHIKWGSRKSYRVEVDGGNF